MFELSIFLKDRLVGRSVFDQEEVRIGRSADNEVWIDNPALSRYHASVEAVAEIHLLKDFGSHNGTFVNGERVVGRRGLNDGDRIQVGKFTLLFRSERKAPVAAAEVRDQASYAIAGATIVMRAPVVDARERACPLAGYLEAAVTGPLSAAPPRHVLTSDFTLAGSGPTCQIALERPAPERMALVVRTWQGFAVVVLAPGVLLNGDPASLTAPLKDGDLLRLGSASFRFYAGRPGD